MSEENTLYAKPYVLLYFQNHDKWKYPVNNKVTPPNSMSYMGPGAAMPGLYDIQNKSIPPEQLIYLSSQIPGGVSVHPQYLHQSVPHQFPMRQGTVSRNIHSVRCKAPKLLQFYENLTLPIPYKLRVERRMCTSFMQYSASALILYGIGVVTRTIRRNNCSVLIGMPCDELRFRQSEICVMLTPLSQFKNDK